MKSTLFVASLLPYCIFGKSPVDYNNMDLVYDIQQFDSAQGDLIDGKKVQWNYEHEPDVKLNVDGCINSEFASSDTRNDISQIQVLFKTEDYANLKSENKLTLGFKVECSNTENLHWMKVAYTSNFNITKKFTRVTMNAGKCQKTWEHKSKHIKKIGLLQSHDGKVEVTDLAGGMHTVSSKDPCKIMNSFPIVYVPTIPKL